jgi:hypothetical protein
VDVVDHDRRWNRGQEGCGVSLGAVGFTGERERDVPMSRKGEVRKMGFAGASWSSHYECGWVIASYGFETRNNAFDQSGVFLCFDRMIYIAETWAKYVIETRFSPSP